MAKKLDILFSEADSFFADKDNFTNENIFSAYTWVKWSDDIFIVGQIKSGRSVDKVHDQSDSNSRSSFTSNNELWSISYRYQ